MTVEFRCRDVGIPCKTVTRAESKDELLAKVAAHAEQAHGVQLTQTLTDYAESQARETGR